MFDYLCTLDREVPKIFSSDTVGTFKNLEFMASLKVNLVWKRRLGNVATLLFLVNRYIPYIYVFMAFEGKASPCSAQNADCTAF